MTDQQSQQQNIQVPEWEHENAGERTASRAEKSHHIQHAMRVDGLTGTYTNTRGKLQPRFDRILPPNRSYLGLRRKWFVIAIICAFLVLLALIIGLAVGLTSRSGRQNLPLPSNRQSFTGDLTYYDPALGSCGITSTSAEAVVAISRVVYDAASTSSDPNQNPLCGRKIRATRFNEQTNSQQSVDLTVVDRCVGCEPTDIDVSITAFTKLAAEELGRVTATWAWL